MPLTQEEVLAALQPIQEPDFRRSIVDLNMVRSVAVDGAVVRVAVDLVSPASPHGGQLETEIIEAIVALGGVDRVMVEVGEFDEHQQHRLRVALHGDPAATAGSQDSHGHAEGRTVPFADAASRTRVLLIASGKGGVGKSSVTTNLSIALAQRGKKVAVVDADVWGFSIPRMLGVDRPPIPIDTMILPPRAQGVACISMGFFVEEEQPVIWRGPMLHKALEQFLTDVFWDDPDFLVIDLPPGTGDISLSLAQFLPRAEQYVVTTPQPAAQKVAQRAAFMGDKVNIETKGIIENMSWFTGDDGKRYELFGAGGGQELADTVGAPLLGQIPLVPELRQGGDDGNPIVVANPESEAAKAFAAIAERIDVELAPTRRYSSALKIV